MALSSPSEEESITGINIAPLVDVILVLLIIFMATAPLIQKRALAVNVPKAANSQPKATETINLSMDAQRQIFLADQPVSLQDLPFQLASLVKADPAVHLAVQADETIPYGEVVQLLDHARGAGVKKVALEVRSQGPRR
jgi:biopolymer transport protein ExbD